jgi:hypothetical protein
LDADVLLMIGDCLDFENYASLLRRHRKQRPVSIFWLLDSLPPVELNPRATKIISRMQIYNRTMAVTHTKLKPVLSLIPRPIRHKFGLAACSRLLNGIDEQIADVAPPEMLEMDINSRYEIYGRAEWFQRHSVDGSIDHVFVNTMSKMTYLNSIGVHSTFVPLGYHPSHGQDLGMERDVDVLFLGEVEYGRRRDLLDSTVARLRSRGIEVRTVTGNCYGRDREELFSRTKVILNIPRFPWDIPTIRFFMGMGCGALMVSERMWSCAPFDDTRHFVQANASDLPDVITHYVKNEKDRLALSKAAHDYVTRDLTMENQVLRILSVSRKQNDPALTTAATRR